MNDTKICPFCGEEIKSIAIKCKYCGSMLTNGMDTAQLGITSPDTLIRQALAEKYELIEEVGKGGMASVYKAIQKSLSRIVALKVIHQNLVHDQEFVKRFLREARLSASLSHPNIVTVYDVGSSGQVHYMAMEYLEGEDLHQKIKRQGALNPEQVVNWSVPIAEALDYIHRKGLLHRDVKSANIFITNSERLVLMDFGIAHAADGTKLTQTGSLMGTPEYMSPEQANGEETTAQSDLWSLGIVLYECLTGKVPFKGDNPLTTIHLVTQCQPATITIQNPKVSKWIESIVLKLLSKDATDRFASGQELAAALQAKKELKLTETARPATNMNRQPKTLYNKSKALRLLPWAIAGLAVPLVLSLWFFVSPVMTKEKAREQFIPIERVKEQQKSPKEILKSWKLNDISEVYVLGSFFRWTPPGIPNYKSVIKINGNEQKKLGTQFEISKENGFEKGKLNTIEIQCTVGDKKDKRSITIKVE